MSAGKHSWRVAVGFCMVAFVLSNCGQKSKDKAEDDGDPSSTTTDGSSGSSGSIGSGGSGTQQAGAPVPGTGLVFSEVAHTSFKVSWGAATDSGDSSLSYKLVYASSKTDIDTLDKADAITGNAASDWLPSSTTSASVTGLTLATSYAVAVLVKNSAGLESLYEPATQMTMPLRIFVTKSTFPPTFSGIADVDQKCASDTGVPSGGNTYKALITSRFWRLSCGSDYNCANTIALSADWPLHPNTTYARPDGTVISTTDSKGLLNFPLQNAFETWHSGYPIIWTGLKAGWVSDTSHLCIDPGNTSSDWNTTSSSVRGGFIDEAYTNLPLAMGGTQGWLCNATGALLCIEQ